MNKTCMYCNRDFVLINPNENADESEPRFICDECAAQNGVPPGWVRACQTEKEVSNEEL